jgi:hypothetical protein
MALCGFFPFYKDFGFFKVKCAIFVYSNLSQTSPSGVVKVV